MTTPEILASELNAFLARRDAKFVEICQSLGEQRKWGELGGLSEEQRAALTEEAEELIETWQAKTAQTAAANATPLQRLLTEYCEIEAQVMKREDEISIRSDALDDDDDDDDGD